MKPRVKIGLVVVAAIMVAAFGSSLRPTPADAGPSLALPISDFYHRLTKKHFGQFITPKTSPIQPERFQGYHAGVDAETYITEKTKNVPIYAVASGTLIYRGTVSGYGGFIALRFTYQNQAYIATYGHIRLSSVTKKAGQPVTVGERLGVLGTGYSAETGGERQHLHFSLLKGSALNFRGYVQRRSDLSAWVDPAAWLSARGVTR